jgi:Ser/Thr protein kinase RdoA (MazF antagonist)
MTLPEGPEILTEIPRRFDVAAGSIRVLADSSYNLVIEFTLASGPRLVLRLDRTDPPSVALEAAILGWLEPTSYPASRLLTGHEEPFILAGYPALLRRYCPGTAIGKTDLVRADYGERIAAAASQLANLHLISGGFHFSGPTRGLFSEIESARLVHQEIQHYVADGQHLVQEAELATAAVKKLLDRHPPLALVHNDFRPQNVLFEAGEVSAVIDFEWSIPQAPAIKDLAHAALEWSTPDGESDIDGELLWSFVDAYNAAIPANHPLRSDRDDLLVWMRFGALADACTFAARMARQGRRVGRSHMYTKATSLAEAAP